MAKKFYAIKEGFDIKSNEKVENKLVDSWDECKKLVVGIKGAKYKSFESIDEANEYLNANNKLLKKGVDIYPLDWMQIYVDGSYNSETERFSYAFVSVKDNKVMQIENGISEDDSQKQLRQIAGELKSVIRGLEYAIQLGEKKVVIIHDYEGIYHHAVGTWKRTDISSQKYYEAVNKLIIDNSLEIIFVKVDSHTGDFFNELTDTFAKLSLGISPTGEVNNWLENNVVYVATSELKEKIKAIINSDNYDNVKLPNENIRIVNNCNFDYENIVSEIKQKAMINDDEALTHIKNLDSNLKDKLIELLILREKH